MPPTQPHPAPTPQAPRPRLSRLVVGYDGSDGANAAAAFALWLAGKAGCEATLVHAGPAPEAAPSADVMAAGADQAVAYEREWRGRLETLREYGAAEAALDCRVVHGNAAGALIATAAETEADLILTGSHGVGRARGALLGSVSSQLLSHAPCSVMVFPEAGPAEPASHARTIVVGIDGSPGSRSALALAQALAAPLGATLVLVHAYDPHIPLAVITTTGIARELRRYGGGLLREARAALADPGQAVEEELVEGRARDVLVDACERHGPALLVVGSRGLGGFKELMLGSTSRWVAGKAACPVVVARGPAHAQ